MGYHHPFFLCQLHHLQASYLGIYHLFPPAFPGNPPCSSSEPDASPAPSPQSSINLRRAGSPVATPAKGTSTQQSPKNPSPTKGSPGFRVSLPSISTFFLISKRLSSKELYAFSCSINVYGSSSCLRC
ncbi:hypothetical protein ACH5RR_006143 [Cinchona calisaya]|uniref:Uncharacterized protein n=1 Tax=Cinchona calisaya TaxID=153742 RepID=A0ABD3AN54_9GENT